MNRELVDVKVLVSLAYDGRAYRPGEWLKMRPVDALKAGELRYVSLNREYSTRAATAAVASLPEKSTKRTYKRRDLQAEQS